MSSKTLSSRALFLALLLALTGGANAEQGNPSPPPPSGNWSVGSNDHKDTISGAAPSGGATYRIQNNGPGTVHVQPKNPSGGDDGPGVDVDPGDSADVSIEAGDHLDVENVNEPGEGDDPATGTYDKV